jgi:outer membrane murein-binding lipoprotein Lpp
MPLSLCEDRNARLGLHSQRGFVAVAARRDGGSWKVHRGAESFYPRGIRIMKTTLFVKVAAVAAVAALAGCTDLKPLQAQVDSLKSEVSSLQSQVAAAKSAADSANSAASSASQAASSAQSTANQALAAAQASQSCCDATNEKIDRMFRRSISK